MIKKPDYDSKQHGYGNKTDCTPCAGSEPV